MKKKNNFNYVGVATVKRKEQKEERMKGKKKGKERKYEESKKKGGRPGQRGKSEWWGPKTQNTNLNK